MSEPAKRYYRTFSDNMALQSENARLKAEVERLTRKLEVADNHAQCLEMVINAGTASELRLKAEVDGLTEERSFLNQRLNHFIKQTVENRKQVERLTAELSNTTAWGRGLESDLSHARVEISFLKSEVERLRKAGDWMCGLLQFDFVTKEWSAAKEGKPSV